MICATCGEVMALTGPVISETFDATPPAQRAQLYGCLNGHWLAMSGGSGSWIPEPTPAPVTILPST